MVVFANARPGREAEFRSWYQQNNIDGILEIDGVVALQRFERVGDEVAPYGFLGLYEIAEGKLEHVRAAMTAAVYPAAFSAVCRGRGSGGISDALCEMCGLAMMPFMISACCRRTRSNSAPCGMPAAPMSSPWTTTCRTRRRRC